MAENLRAQLIQVALQWEAKYGVAPSVTSAIAELDAAILLGWSEADYGIGCQNRTSVTRGHDFLFHGMRYQIKANRPSGKPGSFVTKVGKAKNYDWEILIWILYNREYAMEEAWSWKMEDYRNRFDSRTRLSPNDMREGTCLFSR